jgi:hypothetical protein
MFQKLLGKHDWALDVLEYDPLKRLLAAFKDAIVIPRPEQARRAPFTESGRAPQAQHR